MVTVERKQLGKRVRALRKEENLSLRKFSEMVGISKDFLVDIEFGRKSPTLDTLVRVAGGFDMTLSELFEGIGIPDDDSPQKPVDSTVVRYHLDSL